MSALITFEGVEGAGKTTVIEAVATHLLQHGHHVLKTREPGATALGLRLRESLLHRDDPIGHWAELFLYLADRAQHIEEVIAPALARGAIVLCDRFTDSTIAYQGYGRGLSLEQVVSACRIAQSAPVARTYLLDLEPELGLARAAGRGQGADRIEQETMAFHGRIREGFLTLARQDPERVMVLDATQPATRLVDTIVEEIQDRFG